MRTARSSASATDISTRMRRMPRLRNRVLYFATKTSVLRLCVVFKVAGRTISSFSRTFFSFFNAGQVLWDSALFAVSDLAVPPYLVHADHAFEFSTYQF